MMNRRVAQAGLAEFLGTAMLLCTVIGSGIMAEKLSGGNVAIALLANTLATVFALLVLIETLGPVSGAHFNPVVTLLLRPPQVVLEPNFKPNTTTVQIFRWFVATFYLACQLTGAVLGAWLAHAMFELPILQISAKPRLGAAQWLAEAVATACLLFVIVRSAHAGVRASVLVASTIGAAYWFTASTSFANPAAVLGRMFSDSFAGISPGSALPFVAAQFIGGLIGVALARSLEPPATP